MLDTGEYTHLDGLRNQLSELQVQRSWLLNNNFPTERQVQVFAGIDNILSVLATYPGYAASASKLLHARSWNEYQEHWWTLTIAYFLANKSILREMDPALPNGRVPDMKGVLCLEGVLWSVYVEAKSWRFNHMPEDITPSMESPLDFRVERMEDKLLKQLPEYSLGIWAWDKMRDGISSSHTLGTAVPELGPEESRIIREVCGAVPQLAAVTVKVPDGDIGNMIWSIPSHESKWPQAVIDQLVAALNADVL